MHFISVIHLLGLLLTFLAGSMLIPIPFSFYYGDADYTALSGQVIFRYGSKDVSGAIVGLRSMEQVDGVLRAPDVKLSAGHMARIRTYIEQNP